MSEFIITSVIIPVIISTIFPLFVLAVKVMIFDEPKYKKTKQTLLLENQLNAYGSFLTILEVAETRTNTEQFKTHSEKNEKYFMFSKNPDNNELQEFQRIISEKRYLFSKKIIDEYLKIRVQDTYFGLDTPSKPSKIGFYSIPCGKLKKLVESEYHEMRKKFEVNIGLSH